MFLPNAWSCAQHSLYNTLVPTEFADLCNAGRLSALVHFLWSLVLPLWLACEKRRIFRLLLSSAPQKLPSARARVYYSLFHYFVISYYIGRCLNKAWDLTGIVFPLDFADGIFRRRKATGTLVLDVFFRSEGRRDKRERERSGEMKALVAGDANLTILPR